MSKIVYPVRSDISHRDLVGIPSLVWGWGRPVYEIHIPLPPREVEISNQPFGSTDIEPQCVVSYYDKTIADEKMSKGKWNEVLDDLRKRWYRKLNIRTTEEQALHDEIQRINSIKLSVEKQLGQLPDDSPYKGDRYILSSKPNHPHA
jgi:hypothetical protein